VGVAVCVVVTHSPLTPINGPGSTASGTLELDPAILSSIFCGSVKSCIAISKHWVTAVEDCRCKLPDV